MRVPGAAERNTDAASRADADRRAVRPGRAAGRLASHAVLVAFSSWCLAAGDAAQQDQAMTAAAPSRFRADELGLRLSRQNGNAAYAPRVVSLPGTGDATLEADGRKLPFRFESRDRVALLNELYRIRFFDLPTQYSTRPSARLSDDGSVDTIRRQLSDANVNSVCVSIAAFERCVHYGSEAPLELDRLAQRVFAQAEVLAGGR